MHLTCGQKVSQWSKPMATRTQLNLSFVLSFLAVLSRSGCGGACVSSLCSVHIRLTNAGACCRAGPSAIDRLRHKHRLRMSDNLQLLLRFVAPFALRSRVRCFCFSAAAEGGAPSMAADPPAIPDLVFTQLVCAVRPFRSLRGPSSPLIDEDFCIIVAGQVAGPDYACGVLDSPNGRVLCFGSSQVCRLCCLVSRCPLELIFSCARVRVLTMFRPALPRSILPATTLSHWVNECLCLLQSADDNWCLFADRFCFAVMTRALVGRDVGGASSGRNLRSQPAQ